MTFWNLPGAMRYIDDIVQSIRQGSNVVVRFPGAVRQGLRETVFSAVHGDGFRLTRLDCGSRPMEQISDRYLHGAVSNRRGIYRLFDSSQFSERLIWLDGTDNGNWHQWRQFLKDYADASVAVPVLERTLFFVPLIGTPPGSAPISDAIRVFHWDDVINEIDILAFASDRLLQRGIQRSLVRLLATVIASVAIWDFDLAQRLADHSIEGILRPVGLLRAVAQERGWNDSTPICWSGGTSSRAGVVHASRLAVDEGSKELDRRIWRAQSSVLLPTIDSMCNQMIRTYFEDICHWLEQIQDKRDPFDLEVGDLCEAFHSFRVDYDIRGRINSLRRARNDLAHIRPLSTALAMRIISWSEQT